MDFELSSSVSCVRSHPQEFSLRYTQPGDICILLEPSDEEMPRIRTHQAALQAIFGGEPASLVHLTSLRFDQPVPDHQAGVSDMDCKALIDYFRANPFRHPPFNLKVVGWVPLYVPFDGWNVLKWCIGITPQLREFIGYLHQAVVAVGYRPLYRSWFVPSLITALVRISVMEERSPSLLNMNFPYALFTAKQFEISRINAPQDFTILASFNIS